jgi:hypothetical protein
MLLVALASYGASYMIYMIGVLRASRIIHGRLIESVLRTTLRFALLLFLMAAKLIVCQVAGYNPYLSRADSLHAGYQHKYVFLLLVQ